MRSRCIRRVVVLFVGALVSASSVGTQPRTALTLDRLTAQPSSFRHAADLPRLVVRRHAAGVRLERRRAAPA